MRPQDINRLHGAGEAEGASPYHRGEQALQTQAGMRQQVEKVGRKVIRDFMPDQHRELFEKLPFILAGSLDLEGRPWASILTGYPGFIASPDAQTLDIDAEIPFGDPLGTALSEGAPIGLLGIELETRRRNRMNGQVVRHSPSGFKVRVKQSFGNCPKYIQARQHSFAAEPADVGAARPLHRQGPLLSEAASSLIRRSDTFFIATAFHRDAEAQLDVSHRGGKPGFVRVSEEGGRTELTVPDFRGNFHFATLGNILAEPRAGLLFVDFANGDVLTLTGEAEVILEGPDIERFAGAERLLRFRPQEGALIEAAVPLRWSAPVEEPHLAGTGRWD